MLAALWRNWIARKSTKLEVVGSSPAWVNFFKLLETDFVLLFRTFLLGPFPVPYRAKEGHLDTPLGLWKLVAGGVF